MNRFDSHGLGEIVSASVFIGPVWKTLNFFSVASLGLLFLLVGSCFFAVPALHSSISVVISDITDRRGLFMDSIVLFCVATYVVDRRGSLRDSWLFLLVVIDYGVLIHSFVAFPFKVLGQI